MKNTMKKRLTILTALLGLSLTFTACGSAAPAATPAPPPAQAAAPAAAQAPAQAQTAAPASTQTQTTAPAAGTPIQNLPTEQTAAVAQGAAAPADTASLPAQNAAPSQPVGDMTQQNSYIGEESALQIALAHAGIQASDLSYSYVKLDYDDGIWVYDTEFFSANKEYDYEIEALTGNILSYDYDMESSYLPPANNAQAANASVSLETAKASALAQVSGADDSHIKIHQDYDDGRIVYEGKIIYNNMEYEFEIDAATGNFLEWDAESIFD